MPDFSFCLYAEDPSCHTSEFLTSSNCLLVLDSSPHLTGTRKIIHLHSLWTNCSPNSLTSNPTQDPGPFPLSFTCRGHLVYCCYDLDLRLGRLYRCSLSSQLWGIISAGCVQPLVDLPAGSRHVYRDVYREGIPWSNRAICYLQSLFLFL